MLSLEDGSSSGGGQEVEGTKREGPSEYEISLENKNKQVMFFFFSLVFSLSVCVGPVSTWWDGVDVDSLYLFHREEVCEG